MNISKSLVAAALSVASVGAFADVTVLGTTFAQGASSKSTAIGTFTANGGTFDFKSPSIGTYQGVGISGATKGEIDKGESIVGTFNDVYKITQFTVGLLFDGPEFGDVQEVAKVSVQFQNNSWADYFLTSTYTSTAGLSATWSNLASGAVTNLSPATTSTYGVWSVLNPFGSNMIKSIAFTAVDGLCGTSVNCTNQSDFSLVSVTAVPEVETYAMMLAGLGLMGTIARRRKNKTA